MFDVLSLLFRFRWCSGVRRWSVGVGAEAGKRHRHLCDQSPAGAQIHRSHDRRERILPSTPQRHRRVCAQSGKDTQTHTNIRVSSVEGFIKMSIRLRLKNSYRLREISVCVFWIYECEFDCVFDSFLTLHLQFKFLRKDEDPHVRLEGRDCDDWKCIDFGLCSCYPWPVCVCVRELD